MNLGMPTDMISEILSRKEIRAYINNVFMDVGFNNKFKMRELMDGIIQKKLQEMDENDLGSGKDIMEILALSHKMSMDILDREIKLAEIQAKNGTGGIKNQTNVQINAGDGSNYGNLIERLLKNDQ